MRMSALAQLAFAAWCAKEVGVAVGAGAGVVSIDTNLSGVFV